MGARGFMPPGSLTAAMVSIGPECAEVHAAVLAPVLGERSHHQRVLYDEGDDDREVVLNRARLYHDRRDFHIRFGDTGMRDDYPANPTPGLKEPDSGFRRNDDTGTE